MYKRQTEETSDVRARGQESQQPQEEVTLRTLMDFLNEIRREQSETRREQNEKFEKQKEEANENLKVINEKFDKLEEKLDKHKEEVTQIRAEMREHMNTYDQKINEVQKQQDETIKELKNDTDKKFGELRETREIDRQELKNIAQNTQTSIKKINNKVETHIKENHKKQEELKDELFQTVRQLQQEQGDTNNTIQQKIDEVDGRQKTTELRLDENAREKTTRINELKCQIERLQRQLIEGESGIINRINGHAHVELKYNGTDRFPMEFLKELSVIQQLYYSNNDIKWIGKHLEMDAGIWWRVIRNQISTFEEFKEAFTLKYWGQARQDNIRDNLEYDRYEWNGPITAIQYVERILLESRQLSPTLTDRQLIRKIARHFGRGLQLAVITRGITTIPNFEALITEYTSIQSSNENNRRPYCRPTSEGKVNTRGREGVHNKIENDQKQAWHDRQPKGRFENKQYVNTVQFTSGEASTSRTVNDTTPRTSGNGDNNNKKYFGLVNKIEILCA